MQMTNNELANYLKCNKQHIVQTMKEMNLTRREKMIPLKGEIFKSLKSLGFSKYKVSNKGRFINNDNIIIKQAYTPDGYLGIKMVNDEGKRITSRSNRVIAKIFVKNNTPYSFDKLEVNHKNGIKDDNNVENLEWVTPSENQKHAYKNNLRISQKGENSKLATHTKHEVILVCKALQSKETIKEICEKYNFNRSWVEGIKSRKRWVDVSKDYNF